MLFLPVEYKGDKISKDFFEHFGYMTTTSYRIHRYLVDRMKFALHLYVETTARFLYPGAVLIYPKRENMQIVVEGIKYELQCKTLNHVEKIKHGESVIFPPGEYDFVCFESQCYRIPKQIEAYQANEYQRIVNKALEICTDMLNDFTFEPQKRETQVSHEQMYKTLDTANIYTDLLPDKGDLVVVDFYSPPENGNKLRDTFKESSINAYECKGMSTDVS